MVSKILRDDKIFYSKVYYTPEAVLEIRLKRRHLVLPLSERESGGEVRRENSLYFPISVFCTYWFQIFNESLALGVAHMTKVLCLCLSSPNISMSI